MIAIFSGAQSIVLAEELAKVAGIAEAAGCPDLCDRLLDGGLREMQAADYFSTL